MPRFPGQSNTGGELGQKLGSEPGGVVPKVALEIGSGFRLIRGAEPLTGGMLEANPPKTARRVYLRDMPAPHVFVHDGSQGWFHVERDFVENHTGVSLITSLLLTRRYASDVSKLLRVGSMRRYLALAPTDYIPCHNILVPALPVDYPVIGRLRGTSGVPRKRSRTDWTFRLFGCPLERAGT